MFFNGKKYIRTSTGRIFKCDGWTPILELSDGTWIKPKDFSEEYISGSEELDSATVKQLSLSSDEGIETDNVAPYLCFYGTVVASTVFKFGLILNSLDILKVPSDYFDEKDIFSIWLDCWISSFSVWAKNDVFPFLYPHWDCSVTELVYKNALFGLAKKTFPEVSFQKDKMMEKCEMFLSEFNRAIEDVGRVERLFLTSMSAKQVANYNDFAKVSACLVNRVFDRCHGCKDEDLVYDETSPLIIYDPEEELLWIHAMKRVLDESVRNDNKIFDYLKDGKFEIILQQVHLA